MIIRNPKILIVDNYDSFTFNLVQIFREYGGCSITLLKNDEINTRSSGSFDAFLFSPGAGLPPEAPVMRELLMNYQAGKSFLGICLGHQAIAEAFGASLFNLGRVRHGQKTTIRVTQPADYLFRGLGETFEAGLYHSWSVNEGISDSMINPFLRVTARSCDGIIMALAHTSYDIRGVQFHPESFMTSSGRKIIHNWIDHIRDTRSDGCLNN